MEGVCVAGLLACGNSSGTPRQQQILPLQDAAMSPVEAGGMPMDGGPSDGDASLPMEAGPPPCSTEGAVQGCSTTDGGVGAQTCAGGALGGFAWGACYPTTCDATAQPKHGETCIPGGTFAMGGLDGDAGSVETDTLPAHMVTIRRRFYVEQTEVTESAFMQWWNASPRPVPTDGSTVLVSGSNDKVFFHAPSGGLQGAGTDVGSGCIANLAGNGDYAINCVPWQTALAYCMSQGKRLPTEAEWEWVAIGQEAGNVYPWGTATPDCSHAVFDQPLCKSFPDEVGGFTAGNTPFGQLNNLAGNEAEWTLDFYPLVGCQGFGSCWPAATSDPVSIVDNSTGYVIRGGSYKSPTSDPLRSRARDSMVSDCPMSSTNCGPYAGNVGFRCVRNEQ